MDSRKQKHSVYLRGVGKPKTKFMSFLCDNQETKWISCMGMHNEMIAQIIDDVKERMLLCGNTAQLKDTETIINNVRFIEESLMYE